MEILINISEIAIITGDNPYKTKRDYLIDFWKKNFINDFNKYKEITSFIKETDDDIIKKISVNNNLDISAELSKCIKSKNTCELNTVKNTIIEKFITYGKNIINNKKYIIILISIILISIILLKILI